MQCMDVFSSYHYIDMYGQTLEIWVECVGTNDGAVTFCLYNLLISFFFLFLPRVLKFFLVSIVRKQGDHTSLRRGDQMAVRWQIS